MYMYPVAVCNLRFVDRSKKENTPRMTDICGDEARYTTELEIPHE